MYNMDRTVCNERAYEYIPNKHKMSHNREYYMHTCTYHVGANFATCNCRSNITNITGEVTQIEAGGTVGRGRRKRQLKRNPELHCM